MQLGSSRASSGAVAVKAAPAWSDGNDDDAWGDWDSGVGQRRGGRSATRTMSGAMKLERSPSGGSNGSVGTGWDDVRCAT